MSAFAPPRIRAPPYSGGSKSWLAGCLPACLPAWLVAAWLAAWLAGWLFSRLFLLRLYPGQGNYLLLFWGDVYSGGGLETGSWGEPHESAFDQFVHKEIT